MAHLYSNIKTDISHEVEKTLAALFARMFIEMRIGEENDILRTLKISKRQYLKYIHGIDDHGIYEV